MSADLDLVRRLAAAAPLAVVATARPDGTVHASLVSAGVLDDPLSAQPVVGMVVGGATRKLELLRTSRHATAVFRNGWEWVSVEGPVRLVGPDDPVEGLDVAALPGLLRRIFSAAGGTHDNWAEYDRVMVEQRRTAVLIEPARLLGNG